MIRSNRHCPVSMMERIDVIFTECGHETKCLIKEIEGNNAEGSVVLIYRDITVSKKRQVEWAKSIFECDVVHI